MGNKAFEDITISDIVKKAGVSRMTFYHYFQSKTDALNSYLHEIIELYLEECSRSIGIDDTITSSNKNYMTELRRDVM